MAKDVSASARLAWLSQQTQSRTHIFLDITCPDMTGTLRVVNNTEAIVRNTYTYLPYAFEFVAPSQKSGEIGDGTLTIDIVDRVILETIRSVNERIVVHPYIAMAATPNVTEVDCGEFSWVKISWSNSTTATGSLIYDDILDIIIPGESMTPDLAPGAF